MPRIPQYERQVLPRGQVESRATPEDFGAGVGRAVTEFGQAIGDVQTALVRKRERDAALEGERLLAESRLEWTRRMQEAKLNAPLGAPEFAQSFLDNYDEWSSTPLEQVEAPRARQALRGRLDALRTELGQEAILFEAAEHSRYRVDTVLRIAEDNMNAVRANPAQYPGAISQVESLVADLDGVGASSQAEIRKDMIANISYGAIAGRVDTALAEKDTEQLQGIVTELVESDTWKRDIDANRYAQVLNRARTGLAQMQASGQQAVLEGLSDAIPEMEAGIALDQQAEWHSRIDAVITDKSKKEELHARVRRAAGIGERVNTVAYATPKEIRELVAEASAKVQTQGEYGLDTHEAQTLVKAIQRRTQAIDEDRAQYVIGGSELVASAWNRVREEQSPEAAAEYAVEALSEQRRLGLLDEDVYLLPNQAANAIGFELSQVEQSAEGAESAVQLVQALEEQWGKYWPTVQKQLVEQGHLTGPMAVATGMRSPRQRVAAETLMRAAALGEKAIKRQITVVEPEAKMHATVSQALEEFRATTQYQVGGGQAYADHHEAVRTLALWYQSRGEGWGKAVDRAAREVVNANYIWADTYRIPVDVPGARSVRQGAVAARKKVPMQEIALPVSAAGLSEEEVREAFARVIRTEGTWVTNGDETGLQLVIPEVTGGYTVVERKLEGGGVEPYELTWSELVDPDFMDLPGALSTGRSGLRMR